MSWESLPKKKLTIFFFIFNMKMTWEKEKKRIKVLYIMTKLFVGFSSREIICRV